MAYRYTTSAFFALAFAFAWSLQIPAVLARSGLLPGDPNAYLPFAMLGIFGPMVAATYLTFKDAGRPGVRALFRGLLAWRFSPVWYVAALFGSGTLLSGILFLMHLAGRQGDWHFLPDAAQLVTAFVIAIAEETGWRGFALPRLNAKYGAFLASAILGALWSVWHIPMFMAVGIPTSLAPVMLLYFIGGSLFFGGLYRATGGSLLIAVLAHVGAHLNNSHRALPHDSLPLVAHAVAYAALGLATMRNAALERTRPEAA